jgi:hypothetical protein
MLADQRKEWSMGIGVGRGKRKTKEKEVKRVVELAKGSTEF